MRVYFLLVPLQIKEEKTVHKDIFNLPYKNVSYIYDSNAYKKDFL